MRAGYKYNEYVQNVQSAIGTAKRTKPIAIKWTKNFLTVTPCSLANKYNVSETNNNMYARPQRRCTQHT
jgi:hypothetical protein